MVEQNLKVTATPRSRNINSSTPLLSIRRNGTSSCKVQIVFVARFLSPVPARSVGAEDSVFVHFSDHAQRLLRAGLCSEVGLCDGGVIQRGFIVVCPESRQGFVLHQLVRLDQTQVLEHLQISSEIRSRSPRVKPGIPDVRPHGSPRNLPVGGQDVPLVGLQHSGPVVEPPDGPHDAVGLPALEGTVHLSIALDCEGGLQLSVQFGIPEKPRSFCSDLHPHVDLYACEVLEKVLQMKETRPMPLVSSPKVLLHYRGGREGS
mmetsp:Transcript_18201/g.36907  ORF Transcript_18201/g.36907 Transcript_18201/m.36907 type:complete len:261 (-) Transcript_18201:290-1072(-)